MVKSRKYIVHIAKDIAGTYYVESTYAFARAEQLLFEPYSDDEIKFRITLDDIFPHLTLTKIKNKIRQTGKKYNIIPIIKGG